MIDRRRNHDGDGSDYNPAWIDLNVYAGILAFNVLDEN